jgi:hypothetical protein
LKQKYFALKTIIDKKQSKQGHKTPEVQYSNQTQVKNKEIDYFEYGNETRL